jgi:hypothetical protein
MGRRSSVTQYQIYLDEHSLSEQKEKTVRLIPIWMDWLKAKYI